MALVLLFAPTEARPAAYTFTPIDVPFAGASFTTPSGINDAGQIVGSYVDATNVFHGFLNSGGTFSTINVLLPGGPGNQAFGINNAGQIVGFYDDPTLREQGFLDSGGVFSTITVPFPGVTGTEASGINNRGQIVGSYTDATGRHGFLDTGGVFTPIDAPFPGTLITLARGVNDAGQIVGSYGVPPVPQHGYLDTGGVFTSIDVPFPGVFFTQVFGINDAGQIVGQYGDATGNHGFIDDKGIFTTIDVPFLGAIGTSAEGINDAGQIVGFYQFPSLAIHGFLATPAIPEPPALFLIGSSLIAMMFVAYTKRRRMKNHMRRAYAHVAMGLALGIAPVTNATATTIVFSETGDTANAASPDLLNQRIFLSNPPSLEGIVIEGTTPLADKIDPGAGITISADVQIGEPGTTVGQTGARSGNDSV